MIEFAGFHSLWLDRLSKLKWSSSLACIILDDAYTKTGIDRLMLRDQSEKKNNENEGRTKKKLYKHKMLFSRSHRIETIYKMNM